MKKIFCLMNLTVCLSTLIIVVAPLATTLVAQVPIPAGAIEVQGVGIPMGMPSKEQMGGAKQYHLLNLYAVEVSRISTAVKLEDAQKSKLVVGAKGLAKEKTQEFVKSMGMGMMAGAVMPVGGAPAARPKPKDNEPLVKLAEVKSYADIDVNTKFMFDDTFNPEAKPHEDADWQKLVKSILTPDQYLKYEQALAAQKQNVDKAMVAAGIASLSVDLVLRQDQESKLAALVLDQLAKPKPAPNSDDRAAMGMTFIGGQGLRFMMELAKVEPQKIRDVLDPQQFELIDLKLGMCRGMATMTGAIAVPVEQK